MGRPLSTTVVDEAHLPVGRHRLYTNNWTGDGKGVGDDGGASFFTGWERKLHSHSQKEGTLLWLSELAPWIVFAGGRSKQHQRVCDFLVCRCRVCGYTTEAAFGQSANRRTVARGLSYMGKTARPETREKAGCQTCIKFLFCLLGRRRCVHNPRYGHVTRRLGTQVPT
ncbi:uncharacterized protein LY79DRAFT_315483 [Colletotrichum navitas]|uniref:Uncharacterized protein n=1 Tax=Colletotrichum navitas TaxID=681940 RepID=A0AAD8V2X3_9PEZI|nr:uncharacterized protein LY79DRAFT_315483 [Colletotrichum navitas]KAK1580133.1 hypothetical protein LY79DRAFT_315483 [Colletotrichum navitas]